ncbi:MAG TPA: substrate-binding domain-containing protein, partial [Candidatus Saccharimonadales bacterium]|nr:substrate-binding domain-containing protein [Candidatus Saccharimonadales bacterium]
LVDAGKAKIVFDKYTNNWDPDIAYTNVKNFLDAGNHVDAIISANDGMATGIASALTQANLIGKIPLSGQDADVAAVQRLVAGTQTVTVYKPINVEAYYAILAAYSLTKNLPPPTNATVNNGQTNVPSYLLNPTAVTKNNIGSTVIKDGFLTTQDVYGKH